MVSSAFQNMPFKFSSLSVRFEHVKTSIRERCFLLSIRHCVIWVPNTFLLYVFLFRRKSAIMIIRVQTRPPFYSIGSYMFQWHWRSDTPYCIMCFFFFLLHEDKILSRKRLNVDCEKKARNLYGTHATNITHLLAVARK